MKNISLLTLIVILVLSAACAPSITADRQPSHLTEASDTATPVLAEKTLSPKPTQTFTPTHAPTTVNPCMASKVPDPGSMFIAFVAKWDGDQEIYIVRADGSELTQLTYNNIDDVAPVWSPDGQRVAFASGSSWEVYQLYVINSDGSNRIALTPNLKIPQEFSWSDDGEEIALIGLDNNETGDLYILNIEKLSLTNLTKGLVFGPSRPDWASDGRTIAFDATLDSQGVVRRIYTVELDGSDLRELQSQGFSETIPQWHLSGKAILFISVPGPGFSPEQVYVMRPDGFERKQLTTTDTLKIKALWSPDGQMIAYGAIATDMHREIIDKSIVVMNADGANQKVIAEGKGLETHDFSWAPDSRHIAFISNDSDISNLYVADICTNTVTLVVNDVSKYTPSWKP